MADFLLAVERMIVEKLTECAWRMYAKNTPRSEWTLEFERTLRELGKEQLRKVWPDPGAPESNRWLWDLCWVDCGASWRNLRALDLACEIEWGNDDDSLLEDFLKLTVADAAYRLFVFEADSKRLDAQFDLLIRVCPPSRGYRYLAIGVPNGKPGSETLPYRAWTV